MKHEQNSTIILGIDPGFERIGIALIKRARGEKDTLLYSACFKTKASLAFHERLTAIGSEIERIIAEFKPQALSIEKLFFTTNQKTVMGVAEARGVIVYSASRNGLAVFEYTPPQIKVAVTGYGKADKQMVSSMVPKLIHMDTKSTSDDELDAIAIALTCLACERFSTDNRLLQRK